MRVMVPRQPLVAGSSTCSWVRKLCRASRRVVGALSWVGDFLAKGLSWGALAAVAGGGVVCPWGAFACTVSIAGSSPSTVGSVKAGASDTGCSGVSSVSCAAAWSMTAGSVVATWVTGLSARRRAGFSRRCGGFVVSGSTVPFGWTFTGQEPWESCMTARTTLPSFFACELTSSTVCSRAAASLSAVNSWVFPSMITVALPSALTVAFNEFFGGAHGVLAFFKRKSAAP